MSLVRVWTDIGTGKNVSLYARVVSEHDGVFTIQYLSQTEDKQHGRTIYRYEDDTYEVDDNSITHYLETDIEEDVGFKRIDETGWIREADEEDDDYVPSEEDDDDEEDEEEDDEFTEEEEEDYLDDDEGEDDYLSD